MREFICDWLRALKVLLLLAAAGAFLWGDRVLVLFVSKPDLPASIVNVMLAGALVIADMVANAVAADMALMDRLKEEERGDREERGQRG